MSSLTAEIQSIQVQGIIVNAEALIVDLSDGRTLSVPLVWYPRLLNSTPKERDNWRLIGHDEGINWPDLDEDISLKNLIMGHPSGESQHSLKRWLDSRKIGKKRK